MSHKLVTMNTPTPDDPRSLRSREAIVAAVVAILEEEGPAGITHLRVAERAGVGRATVYRHWPQPADLLQEVISQVPVPFLEQPGDTFRDRLRATLARTRDDFGQPIMQTVLASMIDRSMHDESADEVRQTKIGTVVARMAEGLAEAMEAGELVGEPDADELIARLVGPIFFRQLLQRQSISDDFLERLIDETLAPYTP